MSSKISKDKVNPELYQKLSQVLSNVSQSLKQRKVVEEEEEDDELTPENSVIGENQKLEKNYVGTYVESDLSKTMFATSTLIPNFIIAKGFLMRYSKYEEISVYDHILELIRRILLERPNNPLELIEDYSFRLKFERTKRRRGVFRRRIEFKLKMNILEIRWKYCQTYLGAPEEKGDITKKKLSEQLMVEGIEAEEMDEEEMEPATEMVLVVRRIDDIAPPLYVLIDFTEKAGLGISRETFIHLYMSITRFCQTRCFLTVRFWGKIIGLHKEYFIIETEVLPPDTEEIDITASEYAKSSDGNTDEGYDEEPKIPSEKSSKLGDEEIEEEHSESKDEEIILHVEEPKGKKPQMKADRSKRKEMEFIFEPAQRPVAEEEASGQGANKYVYWVSSDLGVTWIRLPEVLPEQIEISRNFQRYFSGHLTEPVTTYPPFKWPEYSLLRSQIARITASTSVAPQGYYIPEETHTQPKEVDDEEMNEEEEELKPYSSITPISKIFKNTSYQPYSLKELADIKKWVHDRQYILPQGRCTWVKEKVPKIAPICDGVTEIDKFLDSESIGGEEEEDYNVEADEEKKTGEEIAEEEGEEEIEEAEEINVPETGPPLLSSIINDQARFLGHVWELFYTSRIFPVCNILGLKNNNWPGAYTLTNGRQFVNIYLGFGVKRLHEFLPYEVPSEPYHEPLECQQEPEPDVETQIVHAEILEELRLREERRRLRAMRLEEQMDVGEEVEYESQTTSQV